MYPHFAQAVYDTLCDHLIPDACVPRVENAFVPGSICDEAYKTAVAARNRILERMGVEEDINLTCILDELTQITQELGLKMFIYGYKFGKEEVQNQKSGL